MMMVYCSAPSVKYTYDVAMVRTDGSQKQAAARSPIYWQEWYDSGKQTNGVYSCDIYWHLNCITTLIMQACLR